jgi:hypothetical protein
MRVSDGLSAITRSLPTVVSTEKSTISSSEFSLTSSEPLTVASRGNTIVVSDAFASISILPAVSSRGRNMPRSEVLLTMRIVPWTAVSSESLSSSNPTVGPMSRSPVIVWSARSSLRSIVAPLRTVKLPSDVHAA